ncbi:ion transport peptide-like [Trichonephila clavata]|uniref:Ion transport peptide-like n=1 Tax=Trichonephila clavata TaxID=2740835 RepID=A0A8X6KTN4_TRICU|nr:ion transport peptide-like [Trichonephila clavata]
MNAYKYRKGFSGFSRPASSRDIPTIMESKFVTSVLFLLLVINSVIAQRSTKRSFSDLGCMGVYDKAKFARLDRVCEECYQLFRESDVHTFCRSNCFKNDFFQQCVDALLLRKDQKKLDYMVDQLYGR